MTTDFQALVVGGAAAGLSAGLVLGRAQVRTLLVDTGAPSNAVASKIGGLLGQPNTSPAELYAIGRTQVSEHPALVLRDGTVTAIERTADGFQATLGDSATVTTQRVLLATGMRYSLPAIPGLQDIWGDIAFMCPYCHGWEHRDRKLALLGADRLAHRIPLLREWSTDLVAVPGRPLNDEERALLDGTPADERAIEAVAPGVVRFVGGAELAADAFHVFATLEPRDGLAAGLGLATEDNQLGTGFVVVDRSGATSDPRVFAGGDATGGVNVAAAIAGGNLAATSLHRSLVAEA